LTGPQPSTPSLKSKIQGRNLVDLTLLSCRLIGAGHQCTTCRVRGAEDLAMPCYVKRDQRPGPARAPTPCLAIRASPTPPTGPVDGVRVKIRVISERMLCVENRAVI
jgi:hypothetical protein